MSHPHFHAKSSARRFGGVASDYHELHSWLDQSKAHLPDARHRALLHSSFGIFLLEQFFGKVICRRSDGCEVPTRLLAEQHVLEDMGFIPTVQDWLSGLPMRSWMIKGARRLSDAGALGPSVRSKPVRERSTKTKADRTKRTSKKTRVSRR